MSKHLLASGSHTMESLVSEVTENQKVKVFNYLTFKKELARQNLKALTNFSNELLKLIIEQTNKTQKKLIIEQNNLNSMIKPFKKTSLVHKGILEAAIVDKHNYEKGLNFEFNEISNYLSKIFESEPNNPEIKDDNFALLFREKDCNQIDLIDLENYRKATINFTVSDLTYKCGCCKIAQNKYFVYGGSGSSNSSSTMIIDIESQSVESLPSDSPNYGSELCFFDKEIYCFGGTSGTFLKICKKYDFIKKVWIYIQALPKANSDVSGC